MNRYKWILILFFIWAVSSVAVGQTTITFKRSWGKGGNHAGQFHGPFSVAVDPSGNLWVADLENGRIQKIDVVSNVFEVFPMEPYTHRPQSVSLDDLIGKSSSPAADLAFKRDLQPEKPTSRENFVSQQKLLGSMPAFDAPETTFLSKPDPGIDQRWFFFTSYVNQPFSLAIDARNFLYIADSKYKLVQKVDLGSKARKGIGGYGSGFGHYEVPISVAVDFEGNVYVVDVQLIKLLKYGPSGKTILQVDLEKVGNKVPPGISVDGTGNIYVVDSARDKLQKFNRYGKLIREWGGKGDKAGQFHQPVGVATDDHRHVYVADFDNNRIQIFDENGKFLAEWGNRGTEAEKMNGPTGVAVGKGGKIYVCDYKNNRIQEFEVKF